MTSDNGNQATMAPPPHAARIRTFHPRRGRLGARQLDALERLWPAYGIDIPSDEQLPDSIPTTTASRWGNPAALFGRHAPLVLEIGSGMGDATAEMAAADPERDYLAVEVHTPGIANLLALIEEHGLTNVRIARGDALDLLRHLLPADYLAAIHVFFPDPWPKSRHHKRRLIQPAHVALLRSRLKPGGLLHCATDWADYAEAMRETLTADPGLINAFDGYAPRPASRPQTKFERRALAAGRTVFDVIFHRTLPPKDWRRGDDPGTMDRP